MQTNALQVVLADMRDFFHVAMLLSSPKVRRTSLMSQTGQTRRCRGALHEGL